MRVLIPRPQASNEDDQVLHRIFESACDAIDVLPLAGNAIEAIPDKYRNSELVIVDHTLKFGAALMDQMPNIKGVITASTGFDHIDVQAAHDRGIKVCNVPNYSRESVAWFTTSRVPALISHLWQHQRKTQPNVSSLPDFSSNGRLGSHWGIIGFGSIGRRVAEIAHNATTNPPFIYTTTPKLDQEDVKFVGLEQLLEQSDIVTLHVPLTDKTRNMIGEAELRQMKASAFLINTARGGVVDEKALIHAVDSGWIAGAALDVFTEEPPAKDSPIINHPKILSTPHMASRFFPEAQAELTQQVVEVVRSFRNGRPVNQVN